ncbi:WD repeat-containing protein 36 [Anolis carolinensis]|uniref:WD repeat domain 36 n=1 Tax=Anolis carolinensis TaxID=28377 RepID=H9GCG4_ANOCA|nr:PREDICTED: WD repeat-containing protein 36 [Anolis carolinensis]|eukprot:XP_003223040.1 PREDICTED: WD repeat-containing protein 36 [Anolis carolinensis]
MALKGGGGQSALLAGFRALGLYSNHLPHVLRFHRRHREFYLAVAVGSSFHTYNVKKLGIVAVSNALPENITCLAADRLLVFASCGSLLHAFARNKEVVRTYKGHKADIHLLMPFGDHVISVDRDNVLIIWDVQSEEEYMQLNFDKTVFGVSALMHPSTYLNKILLGSEQGSLQLWNIKSNKLLYTFPGWGEGVTVLQQAPAVDVVAVGLVSGHIIVHNIKFDEMLMKFQQDWGPITAISFRTDGHPVMAAGSPVGHIGLWDLEEKKLLGQMRNAHSTAIAGMSFVQGEPLLITNSSDNAIRVWIFDGPGGNGRLLRCRMGHSAPPTKIRYHGQNGHQILSAGQDSTLQSFSTVHERFNKNLGRGSINKKKSKKKGLLYDTMVLPPITTFASEVARQSDWDGIVACHQGYVTCTSWNYHKTSMGIHKLKPKDFSKNKPLGVYATAVDITSCGNFAVIGLTTGQVDVYNMQSGIHRGCYGKEKAHESSIRGVAVDGLNQLTITAGSEGLVKFWKFKTKELVHSTNLFSSPSKMLLHRDSGILGIAMDDFGIIVMDIETRRIVRKFSGHQRQINDFTFSPDGRWLLTASMDCTIRTWDLPSGCLVDCFLVDSAPVSITMSPTGDFLASCHVDDLGIYLWSNRSLYSLVSLRPLPADYVPSVVMLPGTCPSQDVDVTEEEETSDEMVEYDSPDQLGEALVTLSTLPESRWKNLLNLDIIKQKNKPKEPPKVPKSAPFFIPTIPGLVPKYASVEHENDGQQSKIVDLGVLAQKSEFHIQLEETLVNNNYNSPISILKGLGPSNIETELRGLAPEGGGSIEVMQSFLRMIEAMLNTKCDFELAQAYLALFLKLHFKILSSEPTLLAEISRLSPQLEETRIHLQTLFNQSLCILNYIKTAVL